MNPIVDPMFFYWLGIVDNLIILAGVLVGFFATALCVLMGFYFYNKYSTQTWYDDPKGLVEIRRQKASSLFKYYFIVVPLLIISIVATVFTPNKNTLIQMIVAKNITPNNIKTIKTEVATDAKSIVDYIFSKVDGTIREVKK